MLTGTTFNFDGPDFSAGALNGQEGWVAESNWQVDPSANSGNGHVSVDQNFQIATYTQPVNLSSPGETFSYSVNLQFAGGAYATPSAFTYMFLSGLKDDPSVTSLSVGGAPADANIQIISGTDNYRLLNNFDIIPGAANITGTTLDAGDVLRFTYTLTLGINATSTSYEVRLENLTDGTDTGTGTVTGIDSSIYDALLGTGAYVFMQRISPGNGGTNLTDLEVNSVMGDFANGDPTADAGPDQLVILPTDSVTLNGSGVDDGIISSYSWTQISGPSTANLSGTDTPDLTASGLVQGTYEFELTVEDDEMNTASDSVIINVLPTGGSGTITGELKKWHKVTIDFQGPSTSETASTNPFTDYRLDVTFTGPSGQTYVVPGYYAADGNAANTSANSGDIWRVHFAPDEVGNWTYATSFRTGTNVAMSDAVNPGSSAGFFDNTVGAFAVADTDKSGRDFRGKGRLEYVGEHYLQFAETGEYFLKQGPDAPENFLAYDEFDGPFATDGQGDQFIKDWAPHVGDWNVGDPTWGTGKGKGIIGAVNYLASEGQNAFSFLPMNIAGDDKNVFPYLNYSERLRMDVSRLDQWEVVFEHAGHQGMFLHFKTQETENDQLLDGGALGNQRKLYYRELIARFSHHLALNWNLGEENTNTTQQRKDFAQYFHDNDPYQHHIVLHTFPGQKDAVYDPLLGNASEYTGASLQTSQANFSQVHADAAKWVADSAAAGKPWAVAVDEPGDAQHALRPDNDAGNSHVDGRKNALWGTLMAGAWGNEWYFGYGHAHSDLTLEDFRSRDQWWDYTRYALEFFQNNDIPFWEMQNDNSISSASNDYGFYKEGESYVVYLKNGGTTNLDLSGAGGAFDVRWYDPRNGGPLQFGSVTEVAGGASHNLGTAPDSTNQDWAILVSRKAPTGPNTAPQVAINKITPAPAAGEGVYEEENGLVIMEVENTPSNLGLWNQETTYANYTGDGYLQFTGNSTASGPPNSPLEYKFKINQSGLYYLHLRAARDTTNGQPGDHSNDAYVRVEGDYNAGPNAGNNHGDDAPLSMLMSDTKFFGGAANSFSWNSGNRLDPGGHNNKRVAVYDFKAGEEYTLVVSGRSQWFSIDRIVFRHSSVGTSTAQNLSNPESPMAGEASDLAFQLDGIVIDDGQVLPTPNIQWSLDSGPGTAVFGSPNSADTDVEFSTPGTYVVRLTANDDEFVTSATRTVVAPAVDPPAAETTFSATDDAYIEGSTTFNNSVIKIQPSGPSRVGYFKFDVTGFSSSDISGARLRLTVATDPGSGTLNLYEGGSNSWTETSLTSANAPSEGSLVDSVGGDHSTGQIIEFDVSSVVTDNGTYSFVLKHGGGNDVWFSSKEGSAAPQLVIDSGGSADFDLNGVVNGQDFLAWQRGYGLPNALYHEGDANGDDNTDAADLAIWQEAYGGIVGPIAGVVQTEDSSIAAPLLVLSNLDSAYDSTQSDELADAALAVAVYEENPEEQLRKSYQDLRELSDSSINDQSIDSAIDDANEEVDDELVTVLSEPF